MKDILHFILTLPLILFRIFFFFLYCPISGNSHFETLNKVEKSYLNLFSLD